MTPISIAVRKLVRKITPLRDPAAVLPVPKAGA
jgi:hypothetical protein